jgi:formylmethanofuran dehydrogenase subunit D
MIFMVSLTNHQQAFVGNFATYDACHREVVYLHEFSEYRKDFTCVQLTPEQMKNLSYPKGDK